MRVHPGIMCFFLVFGMTVPAVRAKMQSNPIGGGNVSSVTYGNRGLVNKITGHSGYHLVLAPFESRSGLHLTVDLDYNGTVQKAVDDMNAVSPVSWVGLGWNTGFASIVVHHNNTTSHYDDTWEYLYGNGARSPIIRIHDAKYIVKDHPLWKLVPEYDGPDPVIIRSWTLTKTSGIVYRFGASPNSRRHIYCEGDDVSYTFIQGNQRTFYYQWDLTEAVDENGGRLSFIYAQDNHLKCMETYPYISQAYVQRIENERGDRVEFFLGARGSNELVPFPSPMEWYYLEDTWYLDYLRLTTTTHGVIEEIDFIYSREPGEVPHLHHGIPGKEKRLLTRIVSRKTPGAINRTFEYYSVGDPYGFLKRVNAPKTGSELEYEYEKLTITQEGEEFHPIAVKDLKSRSGIGTHPELVTSYTYNTGDPDRWLYITSSRICYWQEVTSNSGTGKTMFTYEINDEKPEFGRVVNTATWDAQENGPIASSVFSYELREFNDVPVAYAVRSEKTRNKITSIRGAPRCGIDGTNGLQTFSYALNSDGVAKVTETQFAFTEYPGMVSANMLTQTCGTRVYKVPGYPEGGDYCDLTTSGMVLSASHTTWSDVSGVWRPRASYTWTRKCDGAGEPAVPFEEFDPADPVANGWQLTGIVEAYNSYGKALESSSPSGLKSAVIYRNDHGLPIAAVANAEYGECAVLTGDYDMNVPMNGRFYLDDENGWYKGLIDASSIIEPSNVGHFGEKTIRVKNAYGPVKEMVVGVDPAKTYVLSAWVNPVNSNGFYAAVEFRRNSDGAKLVPENHQKRYSPPTGEWTKIELKLLKGVDFPLGFNRNDHHVRLWIGNYPSDPNKAEFYIDDIRFRPDKSLVSTTYYHPKWRSAVVTVDANDNPSRKVELDTYGRPVSWYKIAHQGPVNRPDTLVMEKEYHLMGE